jgi:hypothetical protein
MWKLGMARRLGDILRGCVLENANRIVEEQGSKWKGRREDHVLLFVAKAQVIIEV